MSSLLIKNGMIVTLDDGGRVLEDHGVLIENGLIAKVAPLGTFRDLHVTELDAHRRMVMPGLINAHMHFYSTFARGLYKTRPAHNFQEILENLWWKLDKALSLEAVYVSALVALIGGIRHGTTTFIDHHASPNALRGSLACISDAVAVARLRACLAYEVSDRDGAEIAREGIAENEEFIKECQRRALTGDSFVRALFGLHASFTLSDRTLSSAAEKAAALGSGFHVHVAEAESDEQHCRSFYGSSIVERFQRLGILGPNSIFAHCVHVNEQEQELIAASGTKVVHNPQSNMNNAVGVADIVAMAGKGICVGLGTDAMTCNMLEEVRVATWLQKLHSKDPAAGFSEALTALLVNNARIADRYWCHKKLGRIEEGAAADLIVIDYDPPTPLDSRSLLGHICFGAAESAVDTTIVNGRILMKNKKLQLDIDEERLLARARELAKALWEAF